VGARARDERSRIGERHLPASGPEQRSEDQRAVDIGALDVEVLDRVGSPSAPASGSSRRPNSDGESKRGAHHQSIEPPRSTSAAEWQSDKKA
jgi:hypothetical protein